MGSEIVGEAHAPLGGDAALAVGSAGFGVVVLAEDGEVVAPRVHRRAPGQSSSQQQQAGGQQRARQAVMPLGALSTMIEEGACVQPRRAIEPALPSGNTYPRNLASAKVPP